MKCGIIALIFSLFSISSHASPLASKLDNFAAKCSDCDIKNSFQQLSEDVRAVEQGHLEHAKSAFTLIDEALPKIVLSKSANAIRGNEDDCVHLLREIRSFLTCCCQEANSKFDAISEFLGTTFPCDAEIPISSVPFVIDSPGHYCVTEDLFFGGPVAITVLSDNVVIDFDRHVLTISLNNIGIFAENVQNLFIKDGTIACAVASTDFFSRAIDLVNVTHAAIDNFNTLNTFMGINCGEFNPLTFQTLPGVTDLKITNCFHDHPSSLSTSPANLTNQSPMAIRATNSAGITVQNSIFGQIGTSGAIGRGFLVETNCKNTTISNCQFLNTQDSHMDAIVIQGEQNRVNEGPSLSTRITDCTFYACTTDISFLQFNSAPLDAVITNCASSDCDRALLLTGRGFIVENYNATKRDSSLTDLVLLGQSVNVTGAIANPVSEPALDVTIKDSVFAVPLTNAGLTAINAAFVDGALIDGCVLECRSNTGNGCNLSVGRGTLRSANVKARNCVLTGFSQFGVLAATTNATANNHLVLEDCLLDGQQNGILLSNTVSASLDGCTVKNQVGLGIDIGATSFYNCIKNCVVSSNLTTGILIRPGSDFNYITSNKVFNNGGNGIQNTGGPNNQIYFNEACNNSITDCVGIPAILTATPGSLVFHVGQNTCCTSAP